jgi:hypothetical protein
MGAAFDLGRKLGVGLCRERGGGRGVEHADEACASAGEGNEREGPAFGVELRGRVRMRAPVRKIECQRRLRIGAALRPDACRGTADRALPVRADREPHARRSASE